MKHFCLVLCLLLTYHCAFTNAAEKPDVDWDVAYEQLLESKPGVREKVASGAATKADVIAWLKETRGNDKQTGEKTDKKADKAASRPKRDLTAFRKQLGELVKSGKLTKADAAKLMKTMTADVSSQPSKGKGKGTAKGKGKGNGKNTPGVTNFYAILIGRLKTKDIELGEFTLQVDHVSSMYGNRWVKDEIVGQTVTVTGVAGPLLDALLQIRRGKTLQVRLGSYRAKSKTLTIAPKFQVLEETTPFDALAFGVPPQEFRGFHGIVRGKIVEAGGYEVLLSVDAVENTHKASTASDADSIRGKRIRVVGFYNQHGDAFNDLHVGDAIRLSVSHAKPTHDELTVTNVLEKVEK